MDDADYVSVYTVEGKLSAEIIRMMLNSFGVQAALFQESVGVAFGLVVGPVSEVLIKVPAGQVDAARKLLQAMERGDLELPAPPDEHNQTKETDLKPDKPSS